MSAMGGHQSDLPDWRFLFLVLAAQAATRSGITKALTTMLITSRDITQRVAEPATSRLPASDARTRFCRPTAAST
jgi:hypothetical protein